ncbi:hypothetical protein [Methanogenium organophilum]|uniref:MarR family transcriptional regulator n=1 Tax=Methanogenium organophilum TaxID=2199 RepID=A0A9X9S4A8_METOG|nr:hypothetical protein [Methanogenium organophilum]WAI01487.1 hypothetical protein OU421_01040 [Methanogenium organophilum]
MRAEERDWQIYHIIAEKSEITVDEVCTMACTAKEVAEDSLERLQKYKLISRTGDTCAVKSIQEILIAAELERVMNDSPIYMENGVIKVHKESEDE